MSLVQLTWACRRLLRSTDCSSRGLLLDGCFDVGLQTSFPWDLVLDPSSDVSGTVEPGSSATLWARRILNKISLTGGGTLTFHSFEVMVCDQVILKTFSRGFKMDGWGATSINFSLTKRREVVADSFGGKSSSCWFWQVFRCHLWQAPSGH